MMVGWMNRKTGNILLLILFVFGLVYGPIDSGAADSALSRLEIIRVGDQSSLVVREDDGTIRKTIFTYCYISILSDSYDASYYAFLAHGKPIYSEQGDLIGDEGQKLVILNSHDEIVVEIAEARRYAWNPNANQLAILCGDHTESGSEFICKEIVVYDVETHSKSTIPLIAYDIFWAKHDNKIYLDTYHNKEQVFSYDPKMSKLSLTDLQGIYFSSDGSYYYNDQYEGGGEFKVLKTSTHTRVENPSFLKNTDWNAIGWVDSTPILVVSDWFNHKTYAVNIDTAKWVEIEERKKDPNLVYISQDFWGAEFEETIHSLLQDGSE